MLTMIKGTMVLEVLFCQAGDGVVGGERQICYQYGSDLEVGEAVAVDKSVHHGTKFFEKE